MMWTQCASVVLLILLHIGLTQPQCVFRPKTVESPTVAVTVTCDRDAAADGDLWSNRTWSGVVRLNASSNFLNNFVVGRFDDLIVLDLSHNLISDLNSSQFHAPKLAHLDLSYNNLTALDDFSHDVLQRLNVQNNQISKLTLGRMPKLVYLNLGGNEINSMEDISSQVPRLEILNLSTNSIAQLNDNNFNLSSLLRLYLNNNNISFLSEKCFYGLTRLQLLDISDNRITTVFPSMFQYIPLVQLLVSNNPELMTRDFGILLASERLKSVNASRTNQVKIPSCLTRSVRYLSLSNNMIEQIQCGDLDSYPLLNSLDLSSNNISFIEDDALGRLELLQTIVLSHNRLTFIPYTLSSDLKSLHLNHNYLTRIAPSDFNGLSKLEYLDLSSNEVTSIADGSFSSMYGLVSLNLSSNPIEVVSIGTFAGPHKLKVLDLSGLRNVGACKQDLCFPVPEPNELTELRIGGSSELGRRLVNDAAALKTFKQLAVFDASNCNLSDVVDFSSYFPRLRLLNLGGNEFNCSAVREMYVWSDIHWIGDCEFVINDAPTTTTRPVAETTPSVVMTNESLRYSEEAEVVSNEIWISADRLGDVDAYSAEAPTSHPGLFIMLLVPITLACAVLVFNYSRLKMKIRTEKRCEMEMEISNISSELW